MQHRTWRRDCGTRKLNLLQSTTPCRTGSTLSLMITGMHPEEEAPRRHLIRSAAL